MGCGIGMGCGTGTIAGGGAGIGMPGAIAPPCSIASCSAVSTAFATVSTSLRIAAGNASDGYRRAMRSADSSFKSAARASFGFFCRFEAMAM